jgi:hypothetical protein
MSFMMGALVFGVRNVSKARFVLLSVISIVVFPHAAHAFFSAYFGRFPTSALGLTRELRLIDQW